MIASAARTLRLCIMAFSNHCHPPRIRTAMNRAARGGDEVPVRARRHRSPCTRRALTRTDRPGHSGSHLPWLTPQTDLVPDKGQFRSRFPPSAQLLLSGNDFSGSAQPTRHHLSATLLDGRAGAAGPDNAGYEPHPSCGDCPLTGSEPAKKSGQNIPKNRCWTTIAERMVETRAELPFIGDQIVCLSHDQAARGGPARKTLESSQQLMVWSEHWKRSGIVRSNPCAIPCAS